MSDRPALKFPSSETPDVQMISVQTRPDAVARELDLDFGLVCRHQFCADRARHTSSGSGEECAIGCSARQFSVKHRCTRLFAKHCFSEHLGASHFWLTAEGKRPKGSRSPMGVRAVSAAFSGSYARIFGRVGLRDCMSQVGPAKQPALRVLSMNLPRVDVLTDEISKSRVIIGRL